MKHLEKIREYLLEIEGDAVPVSSITEEKAEEISVALEPVGESEELDVLCFDPDNIPETIDPNYEWKFFVDGTMRVLTVKRTKVNGIPIPVHIAHIIAGAIRREGNKLEPALRRSVLVLLMPLRAMRTAGWSGKKPPGISLDNSGDIYEKIISPHITEDILFYSDTSLKLHVQGGESIKSSELFATGRIRTLARNRALVLMRILELGITYELIMEMDKNNEKGLIVLDGPFFLIFKYTRLVSNKVKRIMIMEDGTFNNPVEAFNILRRVIGVVKNVIKIPQKGLEKAIEDEKYITIPIFRFGDIIEEDEDSIKRDAVSRITLSAFLKLRPELFKEIPEIWSPLSGLIRIDIPFPVIMDQDIDREWYLPHFDIDLRRKDIREKLEQVLVNAILERWPIPSTSLHRRLTEYYPIYELEKWLKSQLLHPAQLLGFIYSR